MFLYESEQKTNLDQLVTLVTQTGKMLRDNFKPSHKGSDVCSFLQMKTLHFIQTNKSPTMRNVADFFGITPPSATSLIEGLVKSGHLKREASPTDRRRVHLLVTLKGEKSLKMGFSVMAQNLKKLLSRLPEKDQKDFIRILKKLTSNE